MDTQKVLSLLEKELQQTQRQINQVRDAFNSEIELVNFSMIYHKSNKDYFSKERSEVFEVNEPGELFKDFLNWYGANLCKEKIEIQDAIRLLRENANPIDKV